MPSAGNLDQYESKVAQQHLLLLFGGCYGKHQWCPGIPSANQSAWPQDLFGLFQV
jgi:hypothetical protein